MFKSRLSQKGSVSRSAAVALIATTVFLVMGIGIFIGYTFFWNAYDKDSLAEHNLKVAKERVSSDPKDSDAHVALGKAYFDFGKPDEALTQFQIALTLAPKNRLARYNIAIIKIREQDYAGARKDLEAIKADDPKYWEARTTLGSLLLQMKEYKLSAQELETVNAFEPGNTDVLYKLAQAYEKLGERDKAKATLQLALKYNPTDQALQKALADLR